MTTFHDDDDDTRIENNFNSTVQDMANQPADSGTINDDDEQLRHIQAT